MTNSNKHQYKYDYYISYAEDERSWVHGELLPKLKRRNYTYILDEKFTLGPPTLKQREQAVKESWRTLVILTPQYINSNDKEIISFMGFSRRLNTSDKEYPIIPILLKDIDIGLLLTSVEALDFRNEGSRRLGFERLFDDNDSWIAKEKPPCPYPGMEAFKEKDSDNFYGRETEINQYIDYLYDNKFLALTGVSGCGKSSLVYAGIIPRIRERKQDDQWNIVSIRPSQFLTQNKENDELRLESLFPKYQENNNSKYLVFADQFEEIFTLFEDSNKKNKLSTHGQKIVEALSQISKKAYLILTVRDDFYSQLSWCKKWLNIDPHIFRVNFLNYQDLVSAIDKPAKNLSVYFDKVLIERLVNDAGDDPGILPFIQETLRHLWERMDEQYIYLSDYEKLKGHGVSGLKYAIVAKADAAYKSLPSDSHRNIARRIFIRLVQFGEGKPDTRRQLSISNIRINMDTDEIFNETLVHLSSARYRLLILSGEKKAERRLDIVHESLIGAWEKYKEWLDIYREYDKKRRALKFKADTWITRNNNIGLLDSGEIKEAEKWLQKKIIVELGIDINIIQYVKFSKKNILIKRIKLVIIFFSLIVFLLLSYNVFIFSYEVYIKYSIKKNTKTVIIKPNVFSFSRELRAFNESYSINIPKFSIDAYEVSNNFYCKCIELQKCRHKNKVNICKTSNRNFPVVDVRLIEASEYCHWLDKRIPLEFEWMFAAAGNGKYPINKKYLNKKGVNIHKEQPISIFVNSKVDATKKEIYGLSGNVSEWTISPYVYNNYAEKFWSENNKIKSVTVKGGSWESGNVSALRAAISPRIAGESFSDLGFRCVKGLEPKQVLLLIRKTKVFKNDKSISN